MQPETSPDLFLKLAREMMNTTSAHSTVVEKTPFRALFGITAYVCASVWDNISARLPNGSKPKHLLWGLLFLKVYATEPVNRQLTGSDEKPFRKWSWAISESIADTLTIKWENRFNGPARGNCRVSVDGTDFRIFEPTPFSPEWYSHKFKGPGVRYEVGLCISTSSIVWIHGPFPCGSYPDVKIFRISMRDCLDHGEYAVADGAYMDEKCKTPANNGGEHQYHAIVRARHETVNRRFKQFRVLGGRFRHTLRLHSICFHAVANLTQLMIESEDPLFEL